MANPLRDFFFGTTQPKRELVQAVIPRRTFADVIVPQSTRRALDHALQQIRKRELIFGTWGLGERHATGMGVAFNFAGPPGTGKTACAEAIANALGKPLLVVRYSEMESLWAGETGKNVASVFNAAREQDAVLFFDEADAIAGRRFASITQGYQREANTVVNVLLKELEEFDGVVIFATNLAANFDPAFERRVRTHILFEMPGPEERAQIWEVQLAKKTPLAPDVDFKILGEKYAVSGGDIKNAVLKAAQTATAEPGPDAQKQIHQRHFEAAMQEVLAAKKVMDQSLYSNDDGDGSHASSAMAGFNSAWGRMAQSQTDLESEVGHLTERMGESERRLAALPGIVERFDDAARASLTALRAELGGKLDEASGAHRGLEGAQRTIEEAQRGFADSQRGLEDAQRELKGTLLNLEGGQREAETRQRELSEQLPTLRDHYTKLQEEHGKLGAELRELAQLKPELAQLRGDIGKLGEQARAMGGEVAQLRPALEQMRPALDEHNTRLNDLFARVGTQHTEQLAIRETADSNLAQQKRVLPFAYGGVALGVIGLIMAIIAFFH